MPQQVAQGPGAEGPKAPQQVAQGPAQRPKAPQQVAQGSAQSQRPKAPQQVAQGPPPKAPETMPKAVSQPSAKTTANAKALQRSFDNLTEMQSRAHNAELKVKKLERDNNRLRGRYLGCSFIHGTV